MQMLEWPGNSPDVNSMKNSWSLMKKKVSEKHLSLDALQAAIAKVWKREISPDYCCKLIDSMLHCMQVIKNKGSPTKY